MNTGHFDHVQLRFSGDLVYDMEMTNKTLFISQLHYLSFSLHLTDYMQFELTNN